jgi:hypothetical protein
VELAKPPAAVAEVALEAEQLGANVLYRGCYWGPHIDIFDAPNRLVTKLMAAGFELSRFRERYWRWCAVLVSMAEPVRPPP